MDRAADYTPVGLAFTGGPSSFRLFVVKLCFDKIKRGHFANDEAYPAVKSAARVERSGAGRAGMAPVVLDGGELLWG